MCEFNLLLNPLLRHCLFNDRYKRYKKLQIIALHYIIILYVFLCYEIVNYMIDIIIYVLIFFFFYSFNKVIQMPSNSGWYLQEG